MRTRSDPKRDAMARLPLFDGLAARELDDAARLFDEFDAPAGTVLMREGRPGREVFVVVDGLLEVVLRGRALASLGPGAIAGEIALVDHAPRTATVLAATDVRLLVCDVRAFWMAFHSLGPVRLRILRTVSERLRSVQAAA